MRACVKLMKNMITVRVPHLGDSITSASIFKIHAKPGSSVKVDDEVVTLLTEKVAITVRAEANCVITAFHGKEPSSPDSEGESINVGDPLYDYKPEATLRSDGLSTLVYKLNKPRISAKSPTFPLGEKNPFK